MLTNARVHVNITEDAVTRLFHQLVSKRRTCMRVSYIRSIPTGTQEIAFSNDTSAVSFYLINIFFFNMNCYTAPYDR